MNILEKAQEVTHGDRQDDYGDPRENHERIAALWNAYVHCGVPIATGPHPFTAKDVATMMVLAKIARLIETPDHFDSWADIAGYAWVGSKCAGVKDESD